MQSNSTTFMPKSTLTKMLNLCDHGSYERIYDSNYAESCFSIYTLVFCVVEKADMSRNTAI